MASATSSSAALVSAAILVGYTAYTAQFSFKRSAFRNTRTILHNLPGNVISVTGTVGYLWLGTELLTAADPTDTPAVHNQFFWGLFYTWLVAFLFNTATGFFMIPMLPDMDPASKREFISLVLVQLSFVPMTFGANGIAGSPSTIKYWCWLVTGLGLITSIANVTLYFMDYASGRSNKVCSGSYLVDQMKKQQKERKVQRSGNSSAVLRDLFHDYVTVCFERGSDQTRMPANRLMIFIGISLVFPLLITAVIAFHFEAIQRAYPPAVMKTLGLVSLFGLGTVGNMQVFHGTLALRGTETVQRASWMVAVTVVVECVLVFASHTQVLGYEGFLDFLHCETTGDCKPL